MRALWTVLAVVIMGALFLPVQGQGQEAEPKAEAELPPFDQLPVYKHWETYGEADGLPHHRILALQADGDRLWIGTEHGLSLLEDGKFTNFTTEDGLAYPVVSALALSPQTGDLWIGTMRGLNRLSGGKWETFTQLNSGLVNDVIFGLDVVQDGSVWIASPAGASSYDPKTNEWGVFDTENTTMHEPWCYGVSKGAPGIVYIAAWGGGCLEHDIKKGTWKSHLDPDGEMEIDLFRDDGICHVITTTCSYDNETLWVSTYFGISRFDGTRWRSWMKHECAMPSDFINNIKARKEWVWMGTDNGLCGFNGKHFVVYRQADNGKGGTLKVARDFDLEGTLMLTDDSIGHNFVLAMWPEENHIWVGTSDGLSLGSREPLNLVKRGQGSHGGHEGHEEKGE
jgi:hypothetical protein